MTTNEQRAIRKPEQHQLLAHEPTEKEIEQIFKEVPSTLVIITPTHIIPRSTKTPIKDALSNRGPVYIAGPMRGYPKFNFPAFDAARDAIKALGMAVVSPADLDRAAGFDSENQSDVHAVDGGVLRACIMRDIDVIVNQATAIVLLGGWRKSKGVAVEVALAEFLGIPVYDYDQFMTMFSDEK